MPKVGQARVFSQEHAKHGMQVGTLIKFNQKTVTVLTDESRHWKVPPQLLSKIINGPSADITVIDVNKKTFEPS